jgi:hypothetical protein
MLCPQLSMGIQPGARLPARSADALPATLYGHFTQTIYRNRPVPPMSKLTSRLHSSHPGGKPCSILGSSRCSRPPPCQDGLPQRQAKLHMKHRHSARPRHGDTHHPPVRGDGVGVVVQHHTPAAAPPLVRGLHSSAFELNVSTSLGDTGWHQSIGGQNGSG